MKNSLFRSPILTQELRIKNYLAGFTLIEALVYISISSILLVVMTSLGYNVFVNRQKVLVGEEILENANLVFSRIEYNVRQAKNILLPETTGSELSLEMGNPAINPTRFYLDGTRIFFAQSTGSGTALTTDSVEITNLSFTKLVNDISGISISVSLTIGSSRAGLSRTLTSSFNLPR